MALFVYGERMTLVEFVVIALATWRVATFIYDDKWSGPFDILHRVRYLIGIRYDQQSRKVVAAKPRWRVPIADMHLCIYCMSAWYGLAATVLWLLFRDVAFYVALPFAIATVVAVVQRVTR